MNQLGRFFGAGRRHLLAITALVLASAGPSRADDAFPPCWRGQPGTTYQDWSFGTNNNPANPDTATNANGTAQVALVVGPFGTGWNSSSVGGTTGVWDLGQAGQATAVVPNFGGSPAWKYVQVQVTYFDAPGFYLPPVVSIAGATLVSTQAVVSLPAPPGNWKTLQSVWLLQPSPASETIVFNGDSSKGLLLDEIIVDTRAATAGDGDVPPFRPCWRGQPGTTFQQWLFGASNNPAALTPELVTNAFGTPSASISAGPGSSGYTEENPALGCRQGIWDLGQTGTMTLNVPNSGGGPSSFGYLRLQVTRYRDAIHNANAGVAIAGATLVGQQQQTIETNLSGGQWVVAQTVWRLGPPSPASESIVLTAGPNGTLVDQVVVDTLNLDFPCPSDIVTSGDPGQCSKSDVTWSLPAVNGCTITNVTSTPPSGSTFPVGTNQVTALINDGEGGTTTCSFSVVVIPAADLSVAIDSSLSTVPLGSVVTSTVTVSNAGPCAASGVVLSNAFSSGQIVLTMTNGLIGLGQGCPVPGPVAWWPAAGNANDAAGANNGTLAGGVSFGPGEVGQAFSFDGVSGYVSVPDAPALRVQSLTLEGWLNPQTLNGLSVLIGKRLGAGGTDSYSLWLASGAISAAVSDNAGAGPALAWPVPLNQWTHVAYTFDAPAQTQALYVNGELVAAGLINKAIAYDTHPVLLGADDNSGSPGEFYKGALDELTLYDRALTGTEVRAIYNAGSAGKCPSPGLVPLGVLGSGMAAQVSWVSSPTNCQPLSVAASVMASTADPALANNQATVSIPVQGPSDNDLLLQIQPAAGNNNLLLLSWPQTCDPSLPQAATSLNPPVWGPADIPVLLLDGRNISLVPAAGPMKFFRLQVP